MRSFLLVVKRAGARSALSFAVLLVLSFWLAPMVAWAGGMRVTPILQALPHDRAMAVYRIHNLRDAPLTVQIRAWRWQREAGGRQLEDAPDLLVVPPLVTLAPGQQQLVRIAGAARTGTGS